MLCTTVLIYWKMGNISCVNFRVAITNVSDISGKGPGNYADRLS
jgi:hypothetical protein